MCITQCVDELSCFQAGDLRDHHCKERVGCDVERNTEENIGAALIELAAEFSVRDVELEECVTRRERHLINDTGIIGHNEEAAAVGVGFDLFDDIGELVDVLAVCCFPAAPLFAVNGAEVAVYICPVIPNAHAVFLEIFDVCIASDEPKKLMDDGFKVAFFCGDEGKPFG